MERNKDPRARQRPTGSKINRDRKVSPLSREGTGSVMFRAVARFHLFCVLVIFAVAPTCVARVIAVRFIGEVTNVEVLGADKGLPDDGKLIVESFQIGDPVEGVYTYDTSAPDRAVDSHYGEYGFDAQPFGMTVSANGFVFKSDPMNVSLGISVGNDVKAHEGPGEWFKVQSNNNLMVPQIGDLRCGAVSLELGAYWWPDGPLVDDSLPASAPTLDQWYIRTLTFAVYVGFRGPSVHVSAVLTSAELLPEPARVLHVDAIAASGGDGLSWPTAYSNLQAAIDDANDGDTVLVAPGTYTGDGNRDIDFKGKAITVKSEQGPETCFIDCQGTEREPHRGFDFHSGEGPNAILDGFTVTGGFVSGILQIGGAVRCQRPDGVRAYVSPTIINCIFRGNTAVSGGAIGLYGSQAVISNCIVWNNTAIASGGGIYCAYSSGPRIVNCTICGNRTKYGGGLCLGLGEGPSPALVRNCILWANTSSAGSESFWQAHYGSPAGSVPLEIEHSCFFPVKLPPSDGLLPRNKVTERNNLYVDPQFVDPNAGDLHLKSQAGHCDAARENWVKDDVTSPCIDAGDPNSPVGEEPFPNGGRVNIGAYGGTPEASKSYFGGSTCETIIPGDINGDCRVDFKDLALMAMNWPDGSSGKAGQPAERPEPPLR